MRNFKLISSKYFQTLDYAEYLISQFCNQKYLFTIYSIYLLGMFGYGYGMGMGMGEEIIINNGYGGYGGTTTIIQNGGFFGPREEIIINNNTGVTVVQEIGMFGNVREEIIINNNAGYGGYGGYGINNNYRANRYICPASCKKPCCKPPLSVYNPQKPQWTPPNQRKVVGKIEQPQIVQGTPVIEINKVNQNPYGATKSTTTKKAQQQQKEQVIVYITHSMLQLRYGRWQGPKQYPFSRTNFQRFALNQITKIKCRTNYQPYSDMLQNGEIVMKICLQNNEQFYFAAKASYIRDYFYNISLFKARENPAQFRRFQGQIDGRVRKNNLLGGWQDRYLKIMSGQGLKSYRNQSQNHTIHIKSIRQLWTRFEIIEGKFLIIKFKHNGKKYEYGVPLGYCGTWLQAFYSLLDNYQ